MPSQAGDAVGGALSGAATGAAIGSAVPGIGTAIGAIGGGLIGGIGGWLSGSGDDQAAQDEARRKQLQYQQAAEAGHFGDIGQQNYYRDTVQGNQALGGLWAQAQGQNSVSAEQLRQGMQQNLGANMSMAASANPNDSAMAARNAMMNMNRANYGLAGQQAVAGQQERTQAMQQYGGLIQGLRAQDAQVATASRQNALTGYGAANAGAPAPSWIQQWGPMIQGGLQAYGALKK